MKFNTQLKKLRESLKKNQTEFAEIIGKSQGDVSELENGKQQPTKTLMVYLEYRYGDMSTWGAPASLKKRPMVKETAQEPFIHTQELGKKLSDAGSAIREIGKEIEKLKAESSHKCVDFAELKSLLNGERPPEGVEERRRFMKSVKKIVEAHCANHEGC